jgi:hypothetical protein
MAFGAARSGYRQLWGNRFRMLKRGERRIENNMTGYKVATSVGGLSTGERGDRVILDDPHNVIKAESDLEREKTVRFVRESMSNRINDERSAIVIIMQRLHEGVAIPRQHRRRGHGGSSSWCRLTRPLPKRRNDPSGCTI